MKIHLAQLNPTVGAFEKNTQAIIDEIEQAKKSGCDLVVFAEMSICGYSPNDLLFEPGFVEANEKMLKKICACTEGITAIVGLVRNNPTQPGRPYRNSAAIVSNKKIVGFQDKSLLPTYDIFDEARYFEPAKTELVWTLCKKRVAITVCEDIWPAYDKKLKMLYHFDPLDSLEGKKLDLIINISASPYSHGKIKTRKEVAAKIAKRFTTKVLLVNQVGGQDGVIYDGSSVFVESDGTLLYQAQSFSECRVVLDLEGKKFPAQKQQSAEELYNALVLGLKDYFHKQGFSKAVLGLSGGIDSAVAAAIAKDALGCNNVLCVLLPSRFTRKMSIDDAYTIAKNLDLELVEQSIEKPFTAYLEALDPLLENTQGVTQENLQSRVRAMLLMAIANKDGYLLINTGNKSELAMGYTTLYGDACGAIGVLGDLLKRQIYELARWINRSQQIIPERVLTRAPSAELKKDQKDSDTLPEYPVLDTIVDEIVVKNTPVHKICKKYGYDTVLVEEIKKTIHQNEYKRRQVPFALRVSDKAFSTGRFVPIVHEMLKI